MNIQAISSLMKANGCQPIRNQRSEQQLSPNFSKNNSDNGDIFTPSEPGTPEQKLDLACRLAAYYQSQYEKLQQKTGCYV